MFIICTKRTSVTFVIPASLTPNGENSFGPAAIATATIISTRNPCSANLAPGFPAFDEASARKAKELPARYEALAEELGCLFFNAQTVLSEQDLGGDGLHLTPEGHKKLADAMEAIVRKQFA